MGARGTGDAGDQPKGPREEIWDSMESEAERFRSSEGRVVWNNIVELAHEQGEEQPCTTLKHEW